MKLESGSLLNSGRVMQIAISNGSYKFHLAPLAAEMARHGWLSRFYTAGYVGNAARKYLAGLKVAGVQRLIQRGEDIPPDRVRSCWSAECVLKSGDLLRRVSVALQQQIHCAGFRVYAARVARDLANARCDLYHFRSCYGGDSIGVAKRRGIPVLCDHSVGHPLVNSFMITNEGRWPRPRPGEMKLCRPLEHAMLDDINAADHVLVNSDFVRESFLRTGFPQEKISVVYLGVDDQFLQHVPKWDEVVQHSEPITHLLFAGGFGLRKGACQLMTALRTLPNWQLTIAGGIEPEIRAEYERFCTEHPGRVRYLGFLARKDLAGVMSRHPIFVFPTFLEGSARVVFEALASGCHVITTPNAGSVVKEPFGMLIPPGDQQALANAIQRAVDLKGGIGVARLQAYRLVRDHYKQSDYGRNVMAVYRQLKQAAAS